MSLQSIYDDLNRALGGGTTAALTWTTSTGLQAVLQPLGIGATASLTFTQATLTLGPDAVVLTGNVTWRVANVSWSATLTGSANGNTNAFVIALQGGAVQPAWTIGALFTNPPLPQTRRQMPDGTLVLGPSVLTPLVIQQPLVTVTPVATGTTLPRFQGTLLLTGSELAGYAVYFGSSSLVFDGQIDLTDPAKPGLTLRAPTPGASVTIPHVRATEAGLKLLTSYADTFSLDDTATMSAAVVYVKVQLGSSSPINTETTAPLLQGDHLWPINVSLDETATLGNGLRFILDFFDVPSTDANLFSFPLADTLLNKFYFSGAEFGVRPPLNGQTLGLSYASLQLRSIEEWQPSVPFIKLTELGTGWTYHWYDSGQFVTGNAWGRLTFFEDAEYQIKLLVTASIPDFIITGSTEDTINVPFGRILRQYLGIPLNALPDTLMITRVMVQAMPQQQTYQGSIAVEGVWDFAITPQLSFSLDRIIGEIKSSQSKIYGSLSGFFAFNISAGGSVVTKTTFLVQASYNGATGAWHFSGGLAEGTLSVIDFAAALLGYTPPVLNPTDPVSDIKLTELWFTYDTSTGNPYSARGALEARWTPELLGLTLSLVARASVKRVVPAGGGTPTYEGTLSGTFTINRFAVTAGLSFIGAEKVYLFEVAYGAASLKAATQWVANKPTSPNPTGKHQTLTISLHGMTLGDVVAYLVTLVNPNQNYHLDAPWSVLNSIDLSRFSLILDPTDQTVSVTYNIGLDLGFMSVTSVGLLYDRSNGSGSVRFILTGNLLGQKYGDGNAPLSWDALNDSPPEIPGKGQRLFELNYLGLGQHVTLTGLTSYDSVAAVLAKLREEMQPLDNTNSNPLTQSQLTFDESSQWMFGLDCRVMETLSLGLIMHDPDLYGIVISLAGPDAGSLAGLSFELLYKKVTENVGVFRIRLQVPDAFRQLDFGAVSITLGVITVDIFTNGNFLVDLGFPHNRDFTNSFGLQAGPFIGSGGIYFGLLDGATSKRVPAITNGTFDPVLELGIGLAVGVGRTFNKGPLKAGLYVELVAIIEGTLGWFHPTDTSRPNALYYWVRGTAGIVGKLYGSVDFVLIRVSVSVEAHAFATITLTAYQKTLVELDVGVSVEAEVKILFVTISFSFGLQITTSFTIGEDEVAPWTLAPGQSGLGATRQLHNFTPPRRVRAAHVRTLTRRNFLLARHGRAALRARRLAQKTSPHLAVAPAPVYDLNWSTTVKVFSDGLAHPVTLRILPAYTVDQIAVQWPAHTTPTAASTSYRIAFILLADYAAPLPLPATPPPGPLPEPLPSGDTTFNVLAEALLRWSFSALGLDPINGNITSGQLEELAAQMDLPDTLAGGFSIANLAGFFTTNLAFRLSGLPSGGTPDNTSGIAFPLAPQLNWSALIPPSTTPLTRLFSAYQPIDSTYESEIREYFRLLDPNPTDSSVHAVHSTSGTPESMASFVFRDYFLILAKAAVQAASSVMAGFPAAIVGNEKLTDLCARFQTVTDQYLVHAGDTVDQVAHFYGLSDGEILALNPTLPATLANAAAGSTIPVTLGTTPQSIAAANPAWPITSGLNLTLGDITHQVSATDTLQGITTHFGANLATWLQQSALLDAGLLLLPGATFPVPAARYTNPNSGNCGLPVIAAYFYVRLKGAHNLQLTPGADGVGLVEWYAQAIADLNVSAQQSLPPSAQIPSAYGSLQNPLTWTAQPGDTLWDIATTFALAQNPASNADFNTYRGSVTALNSGTGPFPQVNLPAQTTLVLDNETLSGIATRLPLQLPDPAHPGQYLTLAASFQQLVQSAAILAPLTPLVVPACQVTTQPGQTLGSFAQLYDISLEEVGGRLGGIAGLLAAWPINPPTALAASALTNTGFTLSWTAPVGTAPAGYTIFINGASVGTANTTSFAVTGRQPGTPYLATVCALDAAGNSSLPSAPLLVTTTGVAPPPPATAPNPPTALVASAITTTSLTLSWTAPTGSDPAASYIIYANGTSAGTTTATTFTLTALQPSTPCLLTVVALDSAHNASAPSAPLVATTQALPGHTVTIPHPWSARIGDLVSVTLSTQAANIAGQVSRFLLHGLRLPAPVLGTDGHYHATGPMTGLAELVGQQLTGPAPAPNPPAALSASAITNTGFTLSWTAPTGWDAPASYVISINGSNVGTASTTTFAVTGRQPGTPYLATVCALDAAGNSSLPSAPLLVTTTGVAPPPPATAPNPPTGLVSSAVTTTSLTLSWTAPTGPDPAASYVIYANGTSAGTTTATTFPLTSLQSATSYLLTVVALDSAHNASAPSAPLVATTLIAPRLSLTVTIPTATPWLALYDSLTLAPHLFTATQRALNPHLHRRTDLRLAAALNAPVSQLELALSNDDLLANYPAGTLVQVFNQPPAPSPQYRDVPVRHDLAQHLHWQTTETVPIPNPGQAPLPKTGMPGIWSFTGNLLSSALAHPTSDFSLLRIDAQLGPQAAPVPIALYAWATLVPITLRRIAGRPNTYELFGADTDGRQILLDLWQYLTTAPGNTDSAQLHLLYQLPASSGLPNGLTSVPPDPARTYLVKANLSTETHSGAAANVTLLSTVLPPSSGEYYASLAPADSARFLTLLWECSVIGGGGYWLQYTATDGSPLPDSLFGPNGAGQLSLLVFLGSQTAAAPARVLHPFNNCAVVSDSFDASSSLFAQVANQTETTRQATIAPGNIAFGLQLAPPPPNTQPIDRQISARQLYSLLGYSLVGDTIFTASNPGMPIGPQTNGGQSSWDIFQVIPVSRYAAPTLPAVAGLPAPGSDPYAGISAGGPPSDPVMPTVNVSLNFQDILGNTSLATGSPDLGGPDLIPIPVGYTDPVIGLGAWPATTAWFHISPAASGQQGAQLTASVSLQASCHLPGPSQRGNAAVATATDQLERFSRVYYQVMQPYVTVSLLTSLQQPAGGAPILLQPRALTLALQDFATAACAWLGTATQLGNVYAVVPATPATTLAAISTNCGVGFAQLATANASVPLSRLYAASTGPSLPQYAVFTDGATVAALCPAGTDPKTLLADAENTALPLRPGIELVATRPAYTVPVDPAPPGQPPTLAEIASQNGLSVASLVRANSASVSPGTPGILRVGFVFTYNDVAITVSAAHPDVSLDDIAATLTQEGIPCDAVAVAGANASLPGMFRAGAVLTIDRYLVQDGDTLARNGSGNTVAALANANTTVVNLFPAGAPFYVQSLSAAAVFDEPLGQVARTYGLSAEQILRFNQTVALAPIPAAPADDEYLVLPGQTALPAAPASLRLPYRIPAATTTEPTLATIAALFVNADPTSASAALALATANQNLPRTIRGGITITVGGQSSTPTPAEGCSFAAACALFTPAVQLSALVNTIAGQTGYLNLGGLLLCPPALLPASPGAGNTGFTVAHVAQLYDLDSVNSLIIANRSLTGLIASGVSLSLTVTAPDGKPRTYSVTTGSADTFNSLVWRFNQAGLDPVTAEQIVAGNPTAQLLVPAAKLLLGPPTAQLASPFGTTGWQFPDTIFPLHAWVQIARRPKLVAEPFRGTIAAPGAAVQDQTSIPPVPRTLTDAVDTANQTLALQQFATDLQTAIPQLRIATGKVLSEEQTSSPSDVWAVAFGANFISQVSVAPGVTIPQQTSKIPQFFALRPLLNSLASRNAVDIKPLLADGTLGTAVSTDFQGIDLETWARRFLADIETFLTPDYATPLYQTASRTNLEDILKAKKTLASAIADGLDYVYNLGQPDPARQNPQPPDWLSARETLRQQLLANLVSGYSTGVIAQYQSTVATPWTTDKTRFSGPGQLPALPTGEQRLVTVSSAKTALATTPAGQPAYVNFSISTSEAGQRSSLPLALSYPINEVEFRVTPVVDGYDSSDWLSYILPFNNATTPPPAGVTFNLASPDAPLPLRAYPPLPALLGQTSQPTYPGTTDYTKAPFWNYIVTFQHQSMAVDQIQLQVEFNQPPTFNSPAPATDDLFSNLAQYITVAPDLWAMLQALPTASLTQPLPTPLANALQTFANLVQNVANHWSAHWTSLTTPGFQRTLATGPVPEIYQFTATLTAEQDATTGDWTYQNLTLQRTVAGGSVGWPTLGVFRPDGQFEDLGPGTLQPNGTNLYTFPAGLIPAFQLLRLQATFTSLHIASYQTADATIQVIRNAQLVPGMPPTRPAFVYQTPPLSFADPLTPLLAWDTRFAIGAWTATPATNPLAAVFTSMFNADATQRNISCAILYGYELGGDATNPLVTYLPVKFRPRYIYDTNTLQQIVTAVTNWSTVNNPNPAGGEWVFALALYSSVNGRSDTPILELRRLFSTTT